MNDNNEFREYMSGAELLDAFHLTSREQKLELAVKVLMEELNNLHIGHKNQSLANNIDNQDIYCSCADAYRIGAGALHS